MLIEVDDMDKQKEAIFVCGGGHQGLSMASHLALNGEKVTLWNRTPEHIEKVKKTNKIYCNGAVNGIAELSQISSNIEDVISDFIMVTVPSSAHKDVAERLAPFVTGNTVIVLNPGRTFGAIEFAEQLKKCGVTDMPHIAETQTIVYTCRRSGENSTTIFSMKRDVKIAALKQSNMQYIMEKMPRCLRPYFKVEESLAVTSFSNVGMILHCAPVLMNIGWIESPKVNFKYYYDGISESVARFLEKIDQERVGVAASMGFRVETTRDWLKRTYAIEGENLYDCIRNNAAYREIDAPPSLDSRYITEDVPNGLVPIECLGKEMGIERETFNISLIIDLANAVYGRDFRAEGRQIPASKIQEYI